MAASYPTSVKAFTSRNNGDTIQAAHINDLQDEVNAIETGLKSGLAHNLIFTPDATFDIGASGATRPRNIYASGTVIAGANSGHALGIATNTDVGLRIGGTYTAAGVGIGADIIAGITAAAGSDCYGMRVAVTLAEAGSGTHANLAGLVVTAPVITAGAATVTQATTLYVGGPPAASGATNYSLYVASGTSNLVGNTYMGSGIAMSGTLSPAGITANQNNYNPAGIDSAYFIRIGTDASRDITGIVPAYAGQRLLIANLGGFNAVLKHESVSSTAANRFSCPAGADVTIAPASWREVWYSSIDLRWIVLT